MSEPNTNTLDAMSREELVARARELSINRPELMTRVELCDEIIRLTETDEERRRHARGWLGVARDLVASVVEQRLNLPDAAELIRGANLGVSRHVPPVATVTLAEIYAAQGHLGRAIKLLDEVLLREPDHAAAAALRMALSEQQANAKAEPPVRQSDMPEPHDVSEPWEGDPLASELADTAPSEAEAMAAAEEANDAQGAVAEAATQSAVSGVASVAGASTRDDASEPWASAGEPGVGTNSSEGVLPSFALPVSEPPLGPDESPSGPESQAGSVPPADPAPAPAAFETPQAPAADLLLYRRSGHSLVCHWELQGDTWDLWQIRRDGEWVLRIFQVKPVAGPLEFDERDVSLPGMSGEVLFEIESATQVRLAVGWKSADGFQPIAIGIEVVGDKLAELQLGWCPLPSVDDPPAEFLLQRACHCWEALSVSGE